MTNTNHNYRRARKTETPCRWCIYGLMRVRCRTGAMPPVGKVYEERSHLRCRPGGDAHDIGGSAWR